LSKGSPSASTRRGAYQRETLDPILFEHKETATTVEVNTSVKKTTNKGEENDKNTYSHTNIHTRKQKGKQKERMKQIFMAAAAVRLSGP